MNRNLAWTFAAAILALSVGCTEDEAAGLKMDPRVRLASPPEGAVSISEAVERLQNEPATLTPATLTIVGRIPGGDLEPFEPGQAAFLITELPADGHGEDDPDHADNCPFCKRRAEKAAKAIVKIIDAAGNVVAIDARQFAGLASGDRVTVTGIASFEPAVNLVTISTDRIYVASP